MARSFNGSDANYLSITNPLGALDITGAHLTVSAWVKATSIVANGRIAGKDTQTVTTPRGWNLHTTTSGGSLFRFEVLDAAGGGYSFTTPGITGSWANLVGVHNSGARCSLYKNGVEAAGGNQTRTLADTSWDFTIGRNPYVASSAFNGDIAEVAVWNVALTADEIAALAKGVSPQMVRRASLVAHYPMWGISDAGELDLSGGGQSLAEVGTVGVGASSAPVGPFVLL